MVSEEARHKQRQAKQQASCNTHLAWLGMQGKSSTKNLRVTVSLGIGSVSTVLASSAQGSGRQPQLFCFPTMLLSSCGSHHSFSLLFALLGIYPQVFHMPANSFAPLCVHLLFWRQALTKLLLKLTSNPLYKQHR